MRGFKKIETRDKILAQLYDTVIVDVDKTNRVIKLNTGGWLTMSTRKGMNLIIKAYNMHVFQKKGKLFVCKGSDAIEFKNDTLDVRF